MERFIFVLRQDEENLKQAFCYAKNLLQNVDIPTKDGLEDKQLLKWIPVSQNFDEAHPPQGLCQWITFPSLAKHMQDGAYPGDENLGKQTLELYLHDTADSIPSTGCSVQMYIFFRANDLDSEESFLSLAGVVMRFIKWLHVRIVIVKMESNLSPFGHQLGLLSGGEVQSIVECLQPTSISWCGKISVKDEVMKDGIEYPGFYISCANWDKILRERYPVSSYERTSRRVHGRKEQADTVQVQNHSNTTMCSHTIEVLQEVDLRTFPLFLLTPWIFDLNCFYKTGNGHDLIDYLHEKPCTGLVARLRIYPNGSEIPPCGETSHLSTSAWREYVIAGSPETHVDHVSSRYEYLHCLILPTPAVTPSASSFSSSSASERSCLRMRILLTAKELSRHILSVVKSRDMSSSHDRTSGKQSDNVCSNNARNAKDEEKHENLELISALPVLKIEELFATLQRMTQIRENMKEDGNRQKLQSQTTELEDIFKEQSRNCRTLGDVLKSIGETPEWTSEAVHGLSECPEWIALMAEVPGKTGSVKDSSTVGDGSPSVSTLSRLKPFERTGSKQFSIDHIISLFKENDNNSLKTRLDTNPFRRLSSESDASIDKSWQQHDVYHYYTQDDYDSENKYAQIRDQGDFQDTQSSFMTPKKKASKQFRAVLPTRSSPRTKLFNHKLSSRSPPKPADNTKSTFKHPQSLHGSVSSSHRKRLHSSLTPELATYPPTAHSSNSFSSNSGSGSRSRKRLSSSLTPDVDQPRSSHSQEKASSSHSHSNHLTPDLSQSQQAYGNAISFHRKRSASSAIITPASDSSRPFKFSRTSTPSPSHLSLSSSSSSFLNKSEFEPACETSPISRRQSLPSSYKRVPFTTVLDMPESGVRRSPRKLPGTQSVFTKPVTTHTHKPLESSQRSEATGSSNSRQKTESTPTDSNTKMKRSERHMMRLKSIIAKVLTEKGVDKNNPIYLACSKNLLNVSIILLKSLPNSRNLTDEMKSVVYGQVQQIINLEKRRSGIAL